MCSIRGLQEMVGRILCGVSRKVGSSLELCDAGSQTSVDRVCVFLYVYDAGRLRLTVTVSQVEREASISD